MNFRILFSQLLKAIIFMPQMIKHQFSHYFYLAKITLTLQLDNKINYYHNIPMQVFRKKYLYNPDSPIFESKNVQTYNCMNTENKDNKLILLKHFNEPPFVEPIPGVLQPLENPTMSEPFSVYPLVYCCSEIGKINEADAMYVIKCLMEAKMIVPIYYILSPQGICVSDVQGLLPNPSPPLFEIATELLDIPATLIENQESIVSKDAYQICKGIRDNQSITNLFNNYGWSNPKKEKDTQKDDEFWIFKGKRKEEGPFGDQYSLAWLSKFGLAKFKYIDLSKDGYEEQFYQDFYNKIQFYQKNQSKDFNSITIYKYVKENKGIKIFTEILNQGTLTEYISKKQQQGRALNEKTALPMLDRFVQSMKNLTEIERIRAHGSLHCKTLYVHDHQIVIGEPLLVTDKTEKKLRELKTTFDYYAPQMKENIILPENLFKLSFEKIDIWSFGFILHKVITRDLPSFDPTRKPILSKTHFSPGMFDLINRCLSLTPSNRPSWADINLNDIQKSIVVQEIEQSAPEKQVIRLGTSKQMPSQKSYNKRQSVYSELKNDQEENINISIKDKETQSIKRQQKEQEVVSPISVELAQKLKKVKLISKIIIIMVLYVFVFFRDFLGNSINILLVRTYYGTVNLFMVDYGGNQISTTTIISNQPSFFVNNDVSFSDLQNVYNCINNQFDPIYNPSYSLLDYVQSPSFLGLLLTGWMLCAVICVTKAVSIWKGGISNRPSKNAGRYYVVYGFHQLSLAALLYSHFYVYEFFYFSKATPCFGIAHYTGVEPFFDGSLYLFLQNTSGYLSKIFASLGILAILILLSTCFYAWGPKMDQKYFLSIPSIIFRLIPYILLIFICRIGVFMVYAPSVINDSSSMIPSIMTHSADGFFGIIPEMFILVTITTEVLIELFFLWCEKKASESDKLARFFNVRRKKVSSMQESNAQLNDMSLSKTKSGEQLFQ